MKLAWISKLSKNEKIIFYLSIVLVAVAFLDRGIISPLVNKMEILKEEKKTVLDEMKKNLRIINQRQRIQDEERKYSSFALQARSEEEEIAALLKKLESLATKASVYLVNLKPANVQMEGLVKKFVINLSCEGEMEQLISFIYLVESSNMLLQIGAFNLSPKSKKSTVVKGEILIYKIVLP